MILNCDTSRLRLQCLNSASAKEVLGFYQENKTYFDPYELTRPQGFYTIGYQASALDWEWREIQNRRSLRYYLFLKGNPHTIIGVVNFSDIRYGYMQKASMGYKLHHDYWHQGFAYEACVKCLNIMFREYGLHRIEARIAPSNQPSIRLIERLGFAYEGLELQSAQINHRWQDLYLFAKLNPASKAI